MPGYVMHLALAKKLLPYFMNMSETNILTKQDEYDYYIGNVIPDIKQGSEKKDTHFWTEETLSKFLRKPEMGLFTEKYAGMMNDPFILGYYVHLYFDYYFVNSFWKNHYKFYNEAREESEMLDIKYVEIIKEGGLYDRSTFFSDEYIYGDYTRMIPYIASKYEIPKLDFFEISKQLVRFKKYDNLYKILVDDVDEETTDKFSEMIHKVNINMDNKKNNQLKVFNYEEIDGIIDDVANEIIRKGNI